MNMNFDTNIINAEIMQQIIPLLKQNAKLYLVGGYIRDFLLGKKSVDMDFVVQGQDAIELAKQFANITERYFIILDEIHKIARVIDKDKIHYFDFAQCENNDIMQDLSRRDLTINAIAMQLYPERKIIDLFDGIKDLNTKNIRIINEKNLIDDPLRLLRIFRFASLLDFEPDIDLMNIIRQHTYLIKNVAKERILAELTKLFEGKNSAKYVTMMKDTGLLFEILPILKDVTKIPPNSHHHLPLIEHCIETVKQAEIKIQNAPEFFKQHLNEHLSGVKYISLLKIACLLHDVGKPKTWTIEENGRHRFINHDSIGAELLKPILKDMKFSKLQIKYITTLVKNHIYPSQLARENEEANIKPVARMFRKLENYTPDILLLAMADRLSAQGPAITEEITKNNINALKRYFVLYEDFLNTSKPLPKLLNGNEIAEILNIKKDKNLGIIIKQLYNAQLSGEVTNKNEAIMFIQSIYNKTDN